MPKFGETHGAGVVVHDGRYACLILNCRRQVHMAPAKLLGVQADAQLCIGQARQHDGHRLQTGLVLRLQVTVLGVDQFRQSPKRRFRVTVLDGTGQAMGIDGFQVQADHRPMQRLRLDDDGHDLAAVCIEAQSRARTADFAGAGA